MASVRPLTQPVSELSAPVAPNMAMKTDMLTVLRCAALGLALIVLAPPALADTVGHETARRLVAQGKILPLKDIVSAVRSKVPGEHLETELEYDDGRLVYDFKILRAGGRIQEVEVDAATGRILKIEDDD